MLHSFYLCLFSTSLHISVRTCQFILSKLTLSGDCLLCLSHAAVPGSHVAVQGIMGHIIRIVHETGATCTVHVHIHKKY